MSPTANQIFQRVEKKYLMSREQWKLFKQHSSPYIEMDYFMKFYRPKPKVWLAYDGEAYVGKADEELRLTVDRNIRTRTRGLKLELGEVGERLMDEDMYLMEIKAPAAYPLWLARLLGELLIYPVSFSKYGSYYMAAEQKRKAAALKENSGQSQIKAEEEIV